MGHFWHYNQFLWNAYCAPSIGPDVSDPRFQKENLIFCPNFAYFFLFILSLFVLINARNEDWLHKINTLFDFTVILKFLLHIWKVYSFYQLFSNKHNVVIIKQSVIPCKSKENFFKIWTKSENSFLKVTDIWSNRGCAVCIS